MELGDNRSTLGALSKDAHGKMPLKGRNVWLAVDVFVYTNSIPISRLKLPAEPLLHNLFIQHHQSQGDYSTLHAHLSIFYNALGKLHSGWRDPWHSQPLV